MASGDIPARAGTAVRTGSQVLCEPEAALTVALEQEQVGHAITLLWDHHGHTSSEMRL